MPAIEFPDVEELAIEFLRPALAARTEPFTAAVMVRNEVPTEKVVNGVPQDPWPTSKRLVVVRDDGGPTFWVRGIARLGVQVWAPSKGEASDLANLCMALVGGWSDGVVRTTNPSRPFSVTEVSGRPKQYFSAELIIRGRGLPAA